MMKPAALLLFGLCLSGCCVPRDAETGVSIESYRQALTQINRNMTDGIRPAYAEALERAGYVPEYTQAKLEEFDVTAALARSTATGTVE